MSHSPRPIRILSVFGALAALVALGACAPGGGGAAKPKAAAPSNVQTNASNAGKVTLTVWDQLSQGGGDTAQKALNTAFEKKYPNVTVTRVTRSFSDLKTTLKLALSSKNPPDVVQANQGYPDMGAFVKANLLLPLNNYAKVYKWQDRYPKQLLDLNSFSSDGRTWQADNLYGISQTGEVVGIYYNKPLLKQAGLGAPSTFGDFESDLATIKSKGMLPIQFGDSDKGGAELVFGVLQDAVAGKQQVRDLVRSTGNLAWTSKATVQAAQTLESWVKKGYFTPGFLGLSGDAASTNFGKGQGVFAIDGTWRLADTQHALGSAAGFMVPPPVKAGQTGVTMGGEGLPWSITSKSRHADVAASYIDFITNPDSMDVQGESGNLPVITPPNYKPAAGSLNADVFMAWDQVSKSDGLTPYVDYTTPTFYDSMTGGLQLLVGGKYTPDQFTASLQKDYGSFQKSK